MWNTRLCVNVGSIFDEALTESIHTIAEIGFEGFFTSWSQKGCLAEPRAAADETGLLFQSVHAPFYRAAEMWTENAEAALSELLDCIHEAAECRIPIAVMHTYIGFEPHGGPNEYGLSHFRKVAEEAKKCGVKIALENTEGEEFLAALMKALSDLDNVGFCLDTGHEMCYNGSKDLLALYGDRLIATHINDNLGVRAYDGTITWIDDLHLLPFDGIGDWENFAARLNAHNYTGPLTFELNAHQCKPGRHENNLYAGLSSRAFYTLAYIRACKVASLRTRTRLGSISEC